MRTPLAALVPHTKRARTAGRALAALIVLLCGTGPSAQTAGGADALVFDPDRFTVKTAIVDGRTVEYRAYEGIVYVARPVDAAHQSMNLYVPTAYFAGQAIGRYDARTAPIFFPNSVGGYMPARPGGPGTRAGGAPNAALVALSKGYVVAAPGVRGRTNQDAAGRFVGKAPAVIVDLKAAVRYLRLNDARIPGDAGRIVSNGTSAGGAVSALLAASGNSADFEPYLEALGAARERDDIYAASAYCPITDLDHADMAYEWQFSGVNEYTGRGSTRPPAGRGQNEPGRAGGAPAGQGTADSGRGVGAPAGQLPGGAIQGPPVRNTMTADQIRLSAALKTQFSVYVNGLGLKGPDGSVLTLDPDGNGSFKEHVESFVIASAQKALAGGTDLSALAWLTIANGRVVGLDFARYVRFATRMKATAAFDGQDLGTPENDLFGSETVKARHFTAFGQEHSTVPATLAESSTVRMMNPLAYIGTPGATTARFWRIRHGAIDRDTSLAVSVILATKLANSRHAVDFALPWGVGHSGDYDLNELFDWMARVCR